MRRGPWCTTAREKVKTPTLAQTARMGHPTSLFAKCDGGGEAGGPAGAEQGSRGGDEEAESPAFGSGGWRGGVSVCAHAGARAGGPTVLVACPERGPAVGVF